MRMIKFFIKRQKHVSAKPKAVLTEQADADAQTRRFCGDNSLLFSKMSYSLICLERNSLATFYNYPVPTDMCLLSIL